MSRLIDWLSEYLARRKGLLPVTGIILIFINLLMQLLLPPSWLLNANIPLHIGLIVAIIGLMLEWVL